MPVTTTNITDLELEESCLTDGTQWEVCHADGGDAVAAIVDGPDAQALALLFAAAPQMLAVLHGIDSDAAREVVARATLAK